MPGVVDADTHVIEPAAMWESISETMWPRRPVQLKVPGDTVYGKSNAFWLIDGNIFPRPAGKGGFGLHTPSGADREIERKDIHMGSREMTDVAVRLQDMDARGVDIQVVYPTLFLIYITDDVDLELSVCRAYNDFMGKASNQSNGRIKWVVVPPLHSIDASIAEIRKGKENGAVGVFFRGIEGERSVADPYFYPIYEEANSLNMPITIHTGAGSRAISSVFDFDLSTPFAHVRMIPLMAFRDVIGNKIPEKFPGLRFAFVEAAASWVPYMLHVLRRFARATIQLSGSGPDRADNGWGPQLFQEYNLYVACEADENLPVLLQYTGEDNMIIGSDYGHQDPSEEAQLVKTFRARTDVPSEAIERILCDNARRLYGLS
jgi:predicted TIM-barrel fold metal-dependent hydrolase